MGSSDSFPIIRLEVQRMQHTIAHALTNYAAQMDADIQKAIKEYLTPENVTLIVMTQARTCIEAAIRDEVDKHFRYGKGREIVRRAVLDNMETNP